MGNNFLVTAWNDSGAGHLIRRLDNSPGVFAYPFEVLLGAPVQAGIKNHIDLVKPAYRWNIFRDYEKLRDFWKSNPPKQLSDVFAESELTAWIGGAKFIEMQGIRAKVSKAWIEKYQDKRLAELIGLAHCEGYLNDLELMFSPRPVAAERRVLHCPCMMLDAANPLFSKLFTKVISVTIHPAWGFGNMHHRNGISLDRYLRRWRAVNTSSLTALTTSPETFLSIQTSPYPDQNLFNAQRSYEWITGGTCEDSYLRPTLLGQHGQSEAYPYGGLLAVDPVSAAAATEATESLLAQQSASTKEAYDECVCIFEEISSR